jgi:hypothetical protein
MKYSLLRGSLLLLASAFCMHTAFAQSDDDSCKVLPRFTASFDGIQAKGMLSVEDLAKIKKIKPEEAGVTIIRFTYLIDCGEDCEPQQRVVAGDMFSEEDTKAIQAMKSRNVLSIECILGKDKEGHLVSFKPFLYYIR